MSRRRRHFEDEARSGPKRGSGGRRPPGTRGRRDGSPWRFRAEVETGDPQLVMARWTGNHKRGNERTARNHPRNRR
nr:hypothetical protein [Streptomyces viridochromogenes]